MSKKLNKNIIAVNKADYHRVVLTETLPFEVPFIFSNDGFYRHIKNNQDTSYILASMFFNLITKERRWTMPITYKIRKSKKSLRTMSLMHPCSQYNFIDMYKEYSGIICYHCTSSRISLRSPSKIATSFYKKNIYSNINKYKPDSVETIKTEALVKHATSYFAYNGYSKLHKFINSEEFIELERKYNLLYKLDIFRCFDSIYTHTISWAVKNKSHSKDTVTIKSTFGQKFDSIMQKCNHNETNGILIGPEISRIFAEIILQDIDNKIIEACNKKYNYNYDIDYCIKRYVDDFFVYAIDDHIADNVMAEISQQLSLYNLHINTSKIDKFDRPFYTKASKVIYSVNIQLNIFISKFLQKEATEKSYTYIPNVIRRSSRLKLDFINDVKAVCTTADSDYSILSGYIIASMYNCMLKLIDNNFDEIDKTPSIESCYRSAFMILLEIAFYFYTVEPTVNASYSLGKCIIMTSRFFNNEFADSSILINHFILDLSLKFLSTCTNNNGPFSDGHVPLEKLNIILAISELGNDYLIPSEFAKKLFSTKNTVRTYFEVIVAMYYIKNHSIYIDIKNEIVIHIKNITEDIINATQNADTLYVLLDFLTCPYISADDRRDMLRRYYQVYENKTLGNPKLNTILNYMENNHWFVKWNDLDLLNTLEKKVLKSVY